MLRERAHSGKSVVRSLCVAGLLQLAPTEQLYRTTTFVQFSEIETWVRLCSLSCTHEGQLY